MATDRHFEVPFAKQRRMKEVRRIEAVGVGPVAKLVGRNQIINCCLRSSVEKSGLMAAQHVSEAVTKDTSRLSSTVQYCHRYICVSSTYPTLISLFC